MWPPPPASTREAPAPSQPIPLYTLPPLLLPSVHVRLRGDTTNPVTTMAVSSLFSDGLSRRSQTDTLLPLPQMFSSLLWLCLSQQTFAQQLHALLEQTTAPDTAVIQNVSLLLVFGRVARAGPDPALRLRFAACKPHRPPPSSTPPSTRAPSASPPSTRSPLPRPTLP